MKNKLYIVLNILLMVVMAAFLVYFLFIEKEMDHKRIVESALMIVACLYNLLIRGKVKGTSSRSYAKYEDAYKEILDGVFTEDKKSYKKLLKAAVCYNQDEFKKAHKILDALEKKCVHSKDYVAVYLFQALCYGEEKMYKQSIAFYEKVVQYQAANSTAWSNLGLSYKEMGRLEDAYTAYSNALLYDSKNAHVRVNLADLLLGAGEPEAALEYALGAIKLNANVYQAMSAAAIAYKMLGDNENAEKYSRMYGMNGGNVENLRHKLASI